MIDTPESGFVKPTLAHSAQTKPTAAALIRSVTPHNLAPLSFRREPEGDCEHDTATRQHADRVATVDRCLAVCEEGSVVSRAVRIQGDVVSRALDRFPVML
ncbi:hypothetical protein U1Q18_052254 [Sarracenia purpurea var. burkii]